MDNAIAACTALLGSLVTAQAPVEVGRALALGGDVQGIVISEDQRHALTTGEHGDLVWWDLATREAVSYVAARRPFAQAVLHPSEPLAVVGWTEGGSGDPTAVHVVDLRTGAATPWFERELRTMCLDDDGDRFAVRLGPRAWIYDLDPDDLRREPTATVERVPGDRIGVRFDERGALTSYDPGWTSRDRETRSADGRQRFEFHQLSQPEIRSKQRRHTFACAETWIARAAVSNDGTVLVADHQGQLHFVADGDRQPTVRSAHAGTVRRLVFSPDGRFLAIGTTGGVRIVDRTGAVVHDQPGSSIVCAGSISSEFWLLQRGRAWRYHAGSRRVVGDVVTTDPATSVVVDAPQTDYSAWNLAVHGWGLWRPAQVVSIDGRQWRVLVDGIGLSRRNGSTFEAVADGRHADVIGLLPLPRRGELLLVTGSRDLASGGYDAWLTALGKDGRKRVREPCDLIPAWFAADEREQAIWLGGHGLVKGYRTTDLTELGSFRADWLDAVPWRDGLLLVAVAGEAGQAGRRAAGTLQLLAPHRRQTEATWPVPRDLHTAHCLAASPDRTHIAIANGPQVRILTPT
jgi:hypothetical protein